MNTKVAIKSKLSMNDIKAVIAKVEYSRVPDSTMTICTMYLINGTVVLGHSACIDSANFSAVTGEEVAYSDALDKIWALEGYLLKEKLFQMARPLSWDTQPKELQAAYNVAVHPVATPAGPQPIQPSYGRVVWYHPPNQPEATWPALICEVHGINRINIGGFQVNGAHFAAVSVFLLQAGDRLTEDMIRTGYAEWMPYQQKQANKERHDAALITSFIPDNEVKPDPAFVAKTAPMA